MHKNQFVAIGVAVVERHRLGSPRNVERDIVISQEGDWHALGIVAIGGRELVQIEQVWPQLAFEAGPSGRRMRVVKVRALAVKPFAPMLFLVGAFRNPDMRLGCKLATLQWIHAPSCY